MRGRTILSRRRSAGGEGEGEGGCIIVSSLLLVVISGRMVRGRLRPHCTNHHPRWAGTVEHSHTIVPGPLH